MRRSGPPDPEEPRQIKLGLRFLGCQDRRTSPRQVLTNNSPLSNLLDGLSTKAHSWHLPYTNIIDLCKITRGSSFTHAHNTQCIICDFLSNKYFTRMTEIAKILRLIGFRCSLQMLNNMLDLACTQTSSTKYTQALSIYAIYLWYIYRPDDILYHMIVWRQGGIHKIQAHHINAYRLNRHYSTRNKIKHLRS